MTPSELIQSQTVATIEQDAEPSVPDCPEADAAFEKMLGEIARQRPDTPLQPLRDAYTYAAQKHAKQKRNSGEPYITHPVAVAAILAGLEMDIPTILAGLLHDVVEDTSVTNEELAQKFGVEVAALVDGVTKLALVVEDSFMKDVPSAPEPADVPEVSTLGAPITQHKKSETQIQREKAIVKSAANLRKIFLAMAKDLRVMVIKLADRLHNMRTLGAMPDHKRTRIAEETLQIFAPLAHRLGIWQVKWELEDLAFKYSEPEKFEEVAKQVAQTRGDRQDEVDEAIAILKERLTAEGITDPYVMGRPKHLYSIYQKMLKQELDFKELFDLVALRVIVHSRQECYHALGIISALWTPIPSMYADYIARSKANMYQSLHLKVIGPRGRPVEIQIRTWDMHRTSEFGIAAHWAYKEKGEGGRATDQFERKLNWLRQQLFEWQADAKDAGEFLRSVIGDLFTDQVFVFSPKGDVLDLTMGATPIDFAYRIHSDVGNHCVGAKVNGKMVTLAYPFKNGDVVEIITRPGGHPSRDWLALAKTSHARSKIKAYFKRLHHTDSVQQGRDALQREAERLGLDTHALVTDEALRKIAADFNVPSEEELLAGVGYGTIAVGTVLHKLRGTPLPAKGLVVGKGRADETKMKVSAGAVDNVSFRRSRCCLPIPGDEVVGYVTRGRGMALHRQQCPDLQYSLEKEPERLISVEYMGGDSQLYSVNIILVTLDRTGLLADIGNTFGEQKTFITAIRTQSHRDRTATLFISAEVKDTDHLNRVFQAIRRLPDILELERVIAGGGASKKKKVKT